MRVLVSIAVVTGGLLLALSLSIREPRTAGEALGPAIIDFTVLDHLRMEADDDLKFPYPRPVHVLAEDTVTVFARTHGIERLDVVVAMSGTESFGVFSGAPDRNGFVRIDVSIPEGGSWHDVRVPGPEGKRTAWQLPSRTLFMLVPTGILPTGSVSQLGYGPDNEPAIVGTPVWVRLEE